MLITKKFESSAVNTFKNGNPVNFVYGKNEFLYTRKNIKYLDLVCGSAVTILGHGNTKHKKIAREVINTGIFHTGTRLPNKYREQLYLKLNEILPNNLNCFHLANSGTEAVETALKAVQFATGKKGVISFTGGYHGRTIGALSVTYDKKLRNNFHTLTKNIFFPYPGTYKNKKEKYTLKECLSYAKNYISKNKKSLPPVAIIECVQAVSGIIIPPKIFIREIFKLFKKNKIYIIVDEIWNGIGRTGKFFSFQKFNVKPDIVCLGKALSSTLPLSAVAGPKKLLKSWPSGIHTSTFQGNPVACATSTSTINQIIQNNLLDRVQKIENILKNSLFTLNQAIFIKEIRVFGAQAGIEFINSKGNPNKEIVEKLVKKLLLKKIIVYAGGEKGNVLMLIPPIIIKYINLKKSLNIIIKEILI